MRRVITLLIACAMLLLAGTGCVEPRPVPVILDTDIGHDIDDTWALAFLLASPELDLKLVVTDSHNTEGKAKIVAKFLERVGRTDVPVGIGVKCNEDTGPQASWVADYELGRYPGTVYRDGVQALIDTIMHSRRPVTLIAIGPVPNLAEALRRQPEIARKARLVVMGGSIEKQYSDKPGRCAEYNVRCDPAAAQAAYMAEWPVTMTPLDTAGVVQLTGDRYARVRDAKTPLAEALMENFRIWAAGVGGQDPQRASSILFDTVAVYLAFDEELCLMQDLRIRVTDKGVTAPHPEGKEVCAAMAWNDIDSFYKLLADRMAGSGSDQ